MIAQMILNRQFERRRARLAELTLHAADRPQRSIVVLPSRRVGKTMAAEQAGMKMQQKEIARKAAPPKAKSAKTPAKEISHPKPKLRINLKDVPSQMELTAASWKGNGR